MRPLVARIWSVLRHPASLKARALNTGLWTIVAIMVQHPLRLVSNLVMTRLVEPEAFGLMATVSVLHVGLALFSDVGIRQSIVRDPRGAEPDYLRVAWVVQIIRGLLIAGLLVPIGFGIWFLGPELEGTVYADPALPWMVWGSTFVVLAKGLESTVTVLAWKNLRIARTTLMDITAQLAGLAVMIGAGIAGGGVWALFSGLIAGALARLLLTHTILPGPRMAVVWNRQQVVGMWGFGKWLIGSSIGGYFLNHGDRFVFGMLMDARTFGLYAIAAMWVALFEVTLLRLLEAILFPMISETRELLAGFHRKLMIRILLFSLSISCTAMLFAAVLAPILIRYIYTPEYHAATGLLVLLAFRILFTGYRPLTLEQSARGNSKVQFLAHGVGGIAAMAGPIFLAPSLGIAGSVFCFAMAPAVSYLVILTQPSSVGVSFEKALIGLIAIQISISVVVTTSLDLFIPAS